jgi:hypothetical protein
MNCLQIISHRGLWSAVAEKNTEIAFRRALDNGLGVETDVRDRCGTLVISHNPPTGGELSLAEFLGIYALCEKRPVLALNVKADGLGDCIATALCAAGIHTAFVFDMSIPDTLDYVKADMPVFVRQSEHELVPALYEQAIGVWLDAFRTEWFSIEDIEGHLRRGKKVCLVSPELHGRQHLPLWKRMYEAGLHTTAGVMICTDYPLEARAFFAQPACSRGHEGEAKSPCGVL